MLMLEQHSVVIKVRKAVVVFLIVLVVLSGMVHPTVKALSKTQTGGGA